MNIRSIVSDILREFNEGRTESSQYILNRCNLFESEVNELRTVISVKKTENDMDNTDHFKVNLSIDSIEGEVLFNTTYNTKELNRTSLEKLIKEIANEYDEDYMKTFYPEIDEMEEYELD